MLVELTIRNLAIVEEQSVPFAPGFNVLSGETGSGKSIVLQALGLVLGARASSDAVRSGAEGAEVQALFDLTVLPDEVRHGLPEIAHGDELAITRAVSRSGRGKVYVNGRLATVAMLEEITGRIINICGQNQHVQLLDAAYHLALIDEFAKNEELRASYQSTFRVWRELEQQVAEIEDRRSKNEARRAELEEIVEELGSLELYEGIRESLENAARRQGNAARIIESASRARTLMEGDEGLSSAMHRVAQVLRDIEQLDSEVENLSTRFRSLQLECDELADDLGRYCDSVIVDEEELNAVRDKLAEVARLERKYRTNDAGLAALLEDAHAELGEIEQGESVEALGERLAEARAQFEAHAGQLTKSRRAAAESLSQLVADELKELAMPDATLEVAIESTEPSFKGCDSVELLISPNKGEPARPLRKIASGGELSRIMLVLKKLLRDRSGVNVLIFDEVDAGVSGGVARAVGEKLRALASHSQVICITHLAQVASLADHHLLVQKQVTDRTVSEVKQLDNKQRLNEIARMLAGHKVTKTALESARELLEGRERLE